MNSLLEEIIADFHERPLPELTPRETRLPALNGKVDAVIGMRRTGKTWFLYQRMQDLLGQGILKMSDFAVTFTLTRHVIDEFIVRPVSPASPPQTPPACVARG